MQLLHLFWYIAFKDLTKINKRSRISSNDKDRSDQSDDALPWTMTVWVLDYCEMSESYSNLNIILSLMIAVIIVCQCKYISFAAFALCISYKLGTFIPYRQMDQDKYELLFRTVKWIKIN